MIENAQLAPVSLCGLAASDPRLPDAIVAVQSGDAVRARRLLNDVLAEQPDNPVAWLWMAMSARTTQDAITGLRRAVALAEHFPAAQTALGTILAGQALQSVDSRPAEARAMLLEASRLHPQDGRIWRGLASLATNDEDRVTCYRNALEIAPDDAELKGLFQTVVSRRASLLAHATPVADLNRATDAPPNARKPSAVSPNSSVPTILIVDDSPTVRYALGLMLKREGLNVVAAESGRQALAMVAAEHPSLVFLDILMPELDGYETCRQIRQNPRTATVPVVMLSGKDGFFDKVRGRMAGATEYVTKPFERTAILAVINTHARRSAAVSSARSERREPGVGHGA